MKMHKRFRCKEATSANPFKSTIMSICFTLTTKCGSIPTFRKLLDVVAKRHQASAVHNDDNSVFTICRLGTIFFGYEAADNEVNISAECQTNLLGAGFHKAAIDLIDEVADLNGFPFRVEDETEYYNHRDFEKMRSGHFYYWLSQIVEYCRENIGNDSKSLAICWDPEQYLPEDVDGTVVSPFGRIHLENFVRRADTEGIEALARDFFIWNEEKRDARFYRNSALGAMWEDCCFMPSARSDEDEKTNAFIIENLEQAAALDPSLPFPKEDYLHICRLAGKKPIDVSALPEYRSDYPIGYRKGRVTYRLGNLSFALPGNFIYFEGENSHGYYDDAEERWHVVRMVAYNIPEDEIDYLGDYPYELLTERFFLNGKCRLFDVGPDDDGGDEYVCQCQVITEHQFTLFTFSCQGREEALAFTADFVERLVATHQDKQADLLQQIEQWVEDEEHGQIVEAILQIPEAERSTELTSQLARAYNNLGEYATAIDYLLSIEEESREDSLWFYRLGYAYYYLNKPEDAQPALERAVELDPEDEEAAELLRRCRDGLPPYDPMVYEEEEMDALEAHIEKYIGSGHNVFHEIVSPDIHVDIYIVEPTPERNYYTLVTVGMGARPMNVPPELSEYKLERAEMMIHLPADWNLQSEAEEDYWPMRWLKILARLPLTQDTWLGWGHTIPNGGPLADNTRLSGVLLINPELEQEEGCVCTLPGGDEVNFYQVIPLYEEEMNYKIEHGAEALLERMDEVSTVVDIHRRNVCAK